MRDQHPPITILYEDNHLLGVYKQGGWLVQGDRTGDITMLDMAKSYLKEKYKKPGDVFLGLVHRLDRPVSGVLLFARTSKAASRLANEFRLRRTEKTYLAVVLGRVHDAAGELAGYIERTHLRSRLASGPSEKAKEARLTFTRVAVREQMSLLKVLPVTGRHHQIRLQLSNLGYPVVGDLKYGAKSPLEDKTIALHASRLVVKHPIKDEYVTLESPPPLGFPWETFD